MRPKCPKLHNDFSKEVNHTETVFVDENTQNPGLCGIVGTVKNKDFFMVLDTGATNCFMSQQLAKDLEIEFTEIENAWVSCADKNKSKIMGKVELEVHISELPIKQEFFVVERSQHKILLGSTFAKNNKIMVNYSENELVIGKKLCL